MYLYCFQLAFFRAKFPSPTCFRLSVCLDTSFKLVYLLPTRVELLLHICQLFGVSSFRFFTSLIKVELDLTKSLEASDKIVMEHPKVGERLRLSLPTFLL